MADEQGAVVDRLRRAGCVFAEDEADLLIEAAVDVVELERLVARRVAGEPLEYLLGWAEFCGLRILVGEGVFVPRRRTALLASQTIAHTADRTPSARPVVVELCCGAAAVSAAVLAALPHIDLTAADIDPVAVRYARLNLGDRATVVEGDLYEPLPAILRGRVSVIVANAPYVPTEAIALMPPEARLHERRVALDGGADGADLHRRIAAGAADWLVPGGHLLVEAGREQAELTARLFERAGFVADVVHDDDLDATIVVGVRRPASGTSVAVAAADVGTATGVDTAADVGTATGVDTAADVGTAADVDTAIDTAVS